VEKEDLTLNAKSTPLDRSRVVERVISPGSSGEIHGSPRSPPEGREVGETPFEEKMT
jgi:hypothetical protein